MSCRAPPPGARLDRLPDRKGLHIPGEKSSQEPHMLCPWSESLRWAAKPHKRVTSSQRPQDPREERGATTGRGAGPVLRSFKICHPVIRKREKPEPSAEIRQRWALPPRCGTLLISVDLMLGRARLINRKHAPQWAPDFCNWFNWFQPSGQKITAVPSMSQRGLPRVVYKTTMKIKK